MIKKMLIIFGFIALTSCTENVRARAWGGSQTIKLQPNEIILNATWKQDDLWVFVKDTTTNKVYFKEFSSWGLLNGKITFE